MRSKLLIGGVAAGAALLVGTPLMAEAAGFITSGDIVNSTIRSKDIKNGGVKGKDLANNTVTGAQVAENTLTGVNASTLNSLAPSAYLDRAAYSANTGAQAVPAATITEVRAPLSIDVPAGVSFLSIIGNASYDGTAGTSTTWYALDTPCTTASGTGYDRRVQASSEPNRDNATVVGLNAVTPGTHTVRLCSYTQNAATVFNAQLLVETVAGNATGGATRPGASDGRTLGSVTGR